MSIAVMTKVWKSKAVDRSAKMVLLALSDHSNDEGLAFAGLDHIAAKCSLCRRTIQRTMRRMEKRGVLARVERTDKRGRTIFNGYQIDLEKLASEKPTRAGGRVTPTPPSPDDIHATQGRVAFTTGEGGVCDVSPTPPDKDEPLEATVDNPSPLEVSTNEGQADGGRPGEGLENGDCEKHETYPADCGEGDTGEEPLLHPVARRVAERLLGPLWETSEHLTRETRCTIRKAAALALSGAATEDRVCGIASDVRLDAVEGRVRNPGAYFASFVNRLTDGQGARA